MNSRGARVVRGSAASGVATLVAALFHMSAGGAPPSVVALTLTLTFATLVSIALAGRRSALWRLSASVLLSQFLFHALFTLSPSASFGGIPAGGHLHAGMHLTLVPAVASTNAAFDLFAASDVTMWLSHVTAALVTIAVLRLGARGFSTVCGFAAYRLRRLLVSASVACPVAFGERRAVVESVPLTPRSLEVVLGGQWHRGPPAGAVPAG